MSVQISPGCVHSLAVASSRRLGGNPLDQWEYAG